MVMEEVQLWKRQDESTPAPSSPTPPSSSTPPPPSSTPPSNPPPSTPPPSSSPPPSSEPPTPPSGSATPPPGGSQTPSPPPSSPSTPTPGPGVGGSLSTSTQTYLTTNSEGQQITTTVQVTITPSAPSGGGGSNNGNSSRTSSTPVGAIVGGVVGGIALIIFIVLIWWLIKRRRQKDEFDDLNFDPDRTLQRPAHVPPGNMDLAGAEATPYTYQPPVAVPPPPPGQHTYAAGGHPEMRQSAYYPESSHGGYTDVSSSTGPFLPNPHDSWGRQHATLAAGGVAGAAAAGAGVQRSATTSSGSNEGSAYPPSRNSMGFTLTSPTDHNSHYQPSPATAYPNPYNPRSAKEREAFARTHPQPYLPGGSGLHLATQVETPRDERRADAGGIVVHQDGGRVPQREEDEIPPTYDSIPTEGRR